jgi:hypothetical protein
VDHAAMNIAGENRPTIAKHTNVQLLRPQLTHLIGCYLTFFYSGMISAS